MAGALSGGRDAAEQRLAIVVVSFESRQVLESCLGALSDAGYPVVVVDNASTDGSADFVRERFPKVGVVELERNVGYGSAANVGIEAMSGRFVLVVNADAWPVDAGLDKLLRFAEERADVGVAGPSLTDPDGTRRQSVVGFPSAFWLGAAAISSSPHGVGMRLAGAARNLLTRSSGARDRSLVGAALLLRRAALEQVGAFDPAFFMYGEDVDLCWRMVRAGWSVEICREAEFVHIGGASTSTAATAMYREQLRSHIRFLATHGGLDQARRSHRLLVWVLRVRGWALPGHSRSAFRSSARWLASITVESLLSGRPLPTGETPGAHHVS